MERERERKKKRKNGFLILKRKEIYTATQPKNRWIKKFGGGGVISDGQGRKLPDSPLPQVCWNFFQMLFFLLNTLTTKKGNKFVIVDISFQYNIAKIKHTWSKLGEEQLIFLSKRGYGERKTYWLKTMSNFHFYLLMRKQKC